MAHEYSYLFKFVIVGASSTGKSCILNRLCNDQFSEDFNATIGVEFGSKLVDVGQRTIKLQIWDTAGQERFRSVTRSYYHGAAGCLLVYDISNRQSFNDLNSWLSDVRNLCSENISVVLIGNKKDKEDAREVSFLEASQYAQENELKFYETSALTGEAVEEVFLNCAKTILTKIDSGIIDPSAMSGGIIEGRTGVNAWDDEEGDGGDGTCAC